MARSKLTQEERARRQRELEKRLLNPYSGSPHNKECRICKFYLTNLSKGKGLIYEQDDMVVGYSEKGVFAISKHHISKDSATAFWYLVKFKGIASVLGVEKPDKLNEVDGHLFVVFNSITANEAKRRLKRWQGGLKVSP